MRAFAVVAGQEDDAGAVVPDARQVDAEILLGDLDEELVRHAGEDAGAVAGVLLVAEPAPVHHAAVHVPGRIDDLAARPTLDVADEADTAGILLLPRIVETPAWRQAEGQLSVEFGHRR